MFWIVIEFQLDNEERQSSDNISNIESVSGAKWVKSPCACIMQVYVVVCRECDGQEKVFTRGEKGAHLRMKMVRVN